MMSYKERGRESENHLFAVPHIPSMTIRQKRRVSIANGTITFALIHHFDALCAQLISYLFSFTYNSIRKFYSTEIIFSLKRRDLYIYFHVNKDGSFTRVVLNFVCNLHLDAFTK